MAVEILFLRVGAGRLFFLVVEGGLIEVAGGGCWGECWVRGV